jgi:hypothetical protein
MTTDYNKHLYESTSTKPFVGGKFLIDYSEKSVLMGGITKDEGTSYSEELGKFAKFGMNFKFNGESVVGWICSKKELVKAAEWVTTLKPSRHSQAPVFQSSTIPLGRQSSGIEELQNLIYGSIPVVSVQSQSAPGPIGGSVYIPRQKPVVTVELMKLFFESLSLSSSKSIEESESGGEITLQGPNEIVMLRYDEILKENSDKKVYIIYDFSSSTTRVIIFEVK